MNKHYRKPAEGDTLSARIGINGFGRTRRPVVRTGWGRAGLEFIRINEIATNEWR